MCIAPAAASGQVFSGMFCQPFTLFQQPDGSYSTTTAYAAVAKGDLGDSELLHLTVHVTFLAPDRLVAAPRILQHTCTT